MMTMFTKYYMLNNFYRVMVTFARKNHFGPSLWEQGNLLFTTVNSFYLNFLL